MKYKLLAEKSSIPEHLSTYAAFEAWVLMPRHVPGQKLLVGSDEFTVLALYRFTMRVPRVRVQGGPTPVLFSTLVAAMKLRGITLRQFLLMRLNLVIHQGVEEGKLLATNVAGVNCACMLPLMAY